MLRNWGEQGFDSDLPRGRWALLALGVGVLAVLILLGAMAWSWRVTRYRIDSEAVHMERGVVVRQRRQARLDRLQSVDVEQPLIARVLGLAQLTLRVAGGGNDVAIQYLRLERAEALRAEVLAYAAGLGARRRGRVGDRGAAGPAEGGAVTGDRASEGSAIGGAAAGGAEVGGPVAGGPVARGTEMGGPAVGDPEVGGTAPAPERTLVRVPSGRLVASTAMGIVVPVLVIGVVLIVAASFGRSAVVGVLGALVPMAIGVGSAVWGRFNESFDHTAAASPDGLRLRRGFTAKRAMTVPPGRVQGVELRQPLLWRPFGWWRMRVDTAGRSGSKGDGGESHGVVTVLPVGRVSDVLALLDFLVPDPGAPDASEIVTAAMTGRDAAAGFTVSPRRARLVDPLARRRNGFRTTDTVILLRAGRLVRYAYLVPHAKPQSVALEQGPLQRVLHVVSFAVQLPGGGMAPRAPHLDAATGARLLADEAARGRAARRVAGPERWLERGAPGGGGRGRADGRPDQE